MNTTRSASSYSKHYRADSFMDKLKKRGIIGTLAAFIGSGWLIYEIVHFILVEHYHLPEELKDIAIISILCAMFCTLVWRWFRGEKRRRKIKWEYVFISVFVLAAGIIEASYFLNLGEDRAELSSPILNEQAWKNSLAILPFVNMSADQEQEYFCEGLTEELISKLSQIQELRVPARTSVFVFKGKNVDIREVGQRLKVNNVLEGSVRKSGHRIRITAQLIDAADGYHLWSETYDRDLNDIFAVQDEIAGSVAATLQVTLLSQEKASRQTRNTEAYNAFLMGKYFYGQQTRESLEKAIGSYKRSIALDPAFARAWAGLGSTYAFQAGVGYIEPKKGYAQARTAVKRALALDKSLASAHAVLGWIQMSADWDWARADASYQKAMSLDPRRALGEAAQLAVALGRFDRGLALARRNVELDPISLQAFFTLGFAYWYSGQLEEAIATYRRILEFAPENPVARGLLGQVYLTQSNPHQALAELDLVSDPFWRLSGLAMTYHSLGRKTESDVALAEFIKKYQDVGAYNVAQVYAFRGQPEQAFQWLKRAYDQHDGGMFLIKVDPFLIDLTTDLRYSALLKKMRFPGRNSTHQEKTA